MSVLDTLDASELRIRVGVYDDPCVPIADALGTDEDHDRALQLVFEDGSDGYVTLDGGLWATATRDGERIEGPADRENILAGLSCAETVHVVPYDATPLTGDLRNPDFDEDGLREILDTVEAVVGGGDR